jgi:regulatory protein
MTTVCLSLLASCLLATLLPCLYSLSVPFSSRKLASDQELYAAAVGALARRAHSVYEMRTYLERRADDADAVPRILTRLKQNQYLDDARYARQFVRLRSEVRRQGSFRIARDLRARGVPDKHIEAALAERASESDERPLIRARISRRIKSLRGPLDEKRVASLYRSLLRAGFSADAIRDELRGASKMRSEETTEATSDEL